MKARCSPRPVVREPNHFVLDAAVDFVRKNGLRIRLTLSYNAVICTVRQNETLKKKIKKKKKRKKKRGRNSKWITSPQARAEY